MFESGHSKKNTGSGGGKSSDKLRRLRSQNSLSPLNKNSPLKSPHGILNRGAMSPTKHHIHGKH